jgi:hypothetical protein
MPALQTHPQMHPGAADLQTLFATFGRRLHLANLVQMATFHAGISLNLDSIRPEQMHQPAVIPAIAACHPRRACLSEAPMGDLLLL